MEVEMSWSPFESDKPVRVIVETGRDLAEVFLIDHSFTLTARAVGRLEATVAPGVYKVKAQLGDLVVERLVVVNEETTVDLAPDLAVAGPAPLQEDGRTHEYQRALASEESETVDVEGGSGAEIFLLARCWTPEKARVESTQAPLPGISLHALDGEQVADLLDAKAPLASPGADPAAGVTVAVEPGTYLLRWSDSFGVPAEQAVAAAAGWQTQVFLLEETTGAGAGPREISVLMSRHNFDPQDPALYAVEEARAALAAERKVATEDLCASLFGDFENPMLGLFGAHLMLIASEAVEWQAEQESKATTPPPAPVAFDQKLFDHVVSRLEKILGDEQPDVVALGTKASERPSSRPLRSLPMLWRSWRLLIEASNESPDLVSPDLWRQSLGTLPTRPFFIWSVPEDHAELADHWEADAAQSVLGSAPSEAGRLQLSQAMLAPRAVIDAAIDRARS
jgi:hypothetical protein